MRKVISLILSIVLCFSVLCITPTNNASAENSNICVILNGQTLNFTVQPQMTNGRLLVPMRTIFEAMGATVNWDSTTQTITANRNDITIKMQINSTKVYRNDAEVNIDTPPTIINSSTLVPVRVIAESFNADVVWNDSLSFARYIYIFDYDNINTNNDCYGKYKDIPSMVYYTGFVGSPVDGVDEASISGISTCYTYIMGVVGFVKSKAYGSRIGSLCYSRVVHSFYFAWWILVRRWGIYC